MEISQIKMVLNQPIDGELSQKLIKNTPQTKKLKISDDEPIKEILGKQKVNIQELVESLNKFIQEIDYNLQFIPDQKSGNVIIKVFDKEGNLIRQIPPEAFLSLSSKIGEHIGILINSML